MKPKQRLLKIIGLMEDFQNSDFEVTERGKDRLLDKAFRDSITVIKHASAILKTLEWNSLPMSDARAGETIKRRKAERREVYMGDFDKVFGGSKGDAERRKDDEE